MGIVMLLFKMHGLAGKSVMIQLSDYTNQYRNRCVDLDQMGKVFTMYKC